MQYLDSWQFGVPYAWNQKLEGELKRLQEEGIIEPVRHSEWASPIVPILKSDGSLRICRDYKRTVNSVCKVDVYPLPRVEDLFAKLGGGKKFTKIDLRQAYAQLPSDEGSRQLTTINTQPGLFQYRRLPFGIASAPAIFQRRIEGILAGVPSTLVRVDDILVTGTTDEEYLQNLEDAMQLLSTAGL